MSYVIDKKEAIGWAPKVVTGKKRTFSRAWGKHKNGWIVLVYTGGNTAREIKMLDGTPMGNREISIGHFGIESYIRKHGFEEQVI